MNSKRSLIWFKNDLRLLDQEALVKACSNASFVFPVYIFDPRHYRLNKTLGFSKTGSFRAQFIIESVTRLREDLRKLGADLHVYTGKPEDIIPKIATDLALTHAYATQEVTDEELQVVQLVESKLSQEGVNLQLIWQNTLYHIDDIPWPVNRLPDVFTTFRKEIEAEASVRKSFETPSFIPYQTEYDPGSIPDLNVLGLPAVQHDGRAALNFVGGENYALKRLREYLWEKDLLKKYKETRDGMIGSDYSSKLSPWLSAGCISPKTIFEEVKQYERERIQNDSTYWLIFELMWRDYFRFAANKYGNKIFKQKGIRSKAPLLQNDLTLFHRWQNGETGEAFIDANMKELLYTGFMSNRGRQNVASYLVHDLKVNWQWGAAWFESQLIDYDVSSNWLNWAYVAGVGNDPRQNRYFNPKTQAEKYDATSSYRNLWLQASRNNS